MDVLLLLPHWYSITIVFLFGLIIGSFLDVIVCRFHTGKSINGRSRCLSCGHTLSWYELFPLLSYLVLLGRCKSCGGHIPLRLLCMELCTALLFVFVLFHTSSLVSLFFGLVLCSFIMLTASYDMRHMIIPHAFVYMLLAYALVFISYEAYQVSSVHMLVPHVLSAFGVSLFYFALWLVSKGRWIGLGDAKLSFPLALLLTPLGAFSFVVLSFWVGAVISVVLLCLQKVARSGQQHLPILTNTLTMKSEVPFAPFMLIAFLLVFFAQVDVLSILMQQLP